MKIFVFQGKLCCLLGRVGRRIEMLEMASKSHSDLEWVSHFRDLLCLTGESNSQNYPATEPLIVRTMGKKQCEMFSRVLVVGINCLIEVAADGLVF